MPQEFISHVKSFVLARALIAAVELDLFPLLHENPLSREHVIERAGIAGTPIAHAFLDVLLSSGFLTEDDGLLRLSPRAEAILPVYQSIKSWNAEMALFFESIVHLGSRLQDGRFETTALARYWAYKSHADAEQLPTAAVESYSLVMDASQEQLSQAILQSVDFSADHDVLEFGGGYGRLAMALARHYPNLQVTIADLPAVCEGTQQRIAQAQLDDRVHCLPVDFFAGDLPPASADVALFVRTLHDWSDEAVITLLRRARSCLRPGGRVVIVEPITHTTQARDPDSAATALMVTLFGGARRSVARYETLLTDTGYGTIEWGECGLSLFKFISAVAAPGERGTP